MRPAFGPLRATHLERTTARRPAAGPGAPPKRRRRPQGLFRRRQDGHGRRLEGATPHRPGSPTFPALTERAVAPAADRRGAPVDAPPAAPARRERGLRREAAGFMLAGVFGLVVDIGGYNALVHLGDHGLLADQPLVAKTISLVAGTTVAYVGNRFWTYGHRPRTGFAREYSLYMVFSTVALGIALACLAFSRYVLGLASPVADNIAANGIGLVLGSLFRFLTYRRYVFPEAPA
jgi:putative flippase GtrA